MASIKGSSTKKAVSYADTAKQNAELEQEAMRRKKEVQAQSHQEALQRAMVDLATTSPVMANETAQVVATTPSAVAQPESTPVAVTKPEPVEVQPTPNPVVTEPTSTIDKTKAKRNVSKKDVGELATFSDGSIQFNGQFLIKETKSKEFSTIGFSAPMDIALEAKVKAARDKLSLFELNNLLLALYLEKGIPKEFLERYRKSFN